MDLTELRVGHQRSQDEFDLGSLVRVILELGMVKKRVENSEIGVAELRSAGARVCPYRFTLVRQVD